MGAGDITPFTISRQRCFEVPLIPVANPTVHRTFVNVWDNSGCVSSFDVMISDRERWSLYPYLHSFRSRSEKIVTVAVEPRVQTAMTLSRSYLKVIVANEPTKVDEVKVAIDAMCL